MKLSIECHSDTCLFHFKMVPAPGSQAIISSEKLSQIQGIEDSSINAHVAAKSSGSSPTPITKPHKGLVFFSLLPFLVIFETMTCHASFTFNKGD